MTFEGTIRLNLDRRGYAEKPGAYVGAIRNRLCTAASIRDLTVEQLMDAIQRGYTFTPAAMAGTTGDTWQGQQVICADLDNDTGEKDKEGRKIMLEPPLTPDEARAIMRGHGINPCFMYFTFSNTDTWPKYRAVLVLDQPLTDAAEAADLTARFAGIFNAARPGCADTKIRDSARLLYGGRAGCVFYASKQATSAATLRALPCPPAAATQTETATAPAPASSAQERPRSAPQRAGDIRDEIEVFDLAAYISSTESSREARKGTKLYFNPCPICGHNDCFQVTGHLWHCWSSNHSGTNAGTVIDFLQRRHNLTLAEAMRMFDYDILHPASVDFAPTDRALDWNDTIGGGAQQAQEGQSMQAAQEAQQMPPTQAAEDQQPPKLGDGISTYIREKMQGEIDAFASAGAISTGFSFLDMRSSGGLFPGLYAVGAISSLGKTTLIHQIADQIAAGGQDVLFFSLEQSRLELASKSLARWTAEQNDLDGLTSLKIRQGITTRSLAWAIQEYTQAVEDRLQIIEGGFRYTVENLCEYVAAYMKQRSTAPVVILDYLQILNTIQKKATRRDEIDGIVSTLKVLSEKLKIPVIVISSVNRANYLTPVDFESFKESGGIEYTADVVWGLQLACLEEKLFEQNARITEKRERIKQAKAEMPRKVQLVCLKNRYGITDWKVDFKYYPQFDWFEEYSGTTAAEFEKAAREEAERAAEERKKRQKRIGATDTLKDLARYVAEELKSAEAEIDPLS
jgi:replicative DNA helicase